MGECNAPLGENKCYFNSTNESGEKLKKYQSKAGGQTDIILNWFVSNPDEKRSPSEIHFKLFGVKTPLTSVRRSMTVLTKCKNLIKLDEKREGLYGREEHLWALNNDIDWDEENC